MSVVLPNTDVFVGNSAIIAITRDFYCLVIFQAPCIELPGSKSKKHLIPMSVVLPNTDVFVRNSAVIAITRFLLSSFFSSTLYRITVFYSHFYLLI